MFKTKNIKIKKNQIEYYKKYYNKNIFFYKLKFF